VDPGTTLQSREQTGGLGTLELRHPAGTFAPSPATRVTLQAVARHRRHLDGTGVDWGCGVGVLSLGAARLDSVDRVIGLDLSYANVAAARENAHLNGVGHKTTFAVADSYEPLEPAAGALLEPLRGRLDFVIANPPHSASSDGFDFRRRVIREGAEFVRPGGLILIQALSAYGPARVDELAATEYAYEGVVLRTDLVQLDVGSAQFRHQLATYVREERRGGRPYEFFVAGGPEGPRTAVQTLAALRAGETILGRWQVHRFRRLA
jgi:methylase of polypeptide subunit release factors